MHWMVVVYWLWHRLKTNGWARLPDSGPAILIANHTCGIDHLVLQAGCRRVLGFMIAREYYDWPLIHWFCKRVGCIPVNRDGRDIYATRAALRALKEGRVLPIFPEGQITPSSGRVLGPMRPGAAFLAIRSGVPVIPAYIRGTPETNQMDPRGRLLASHGALRRPHRPERHPACPGRQQGGPGRSLAPFLRGWWICATVVQRLGSPGRKFPTDRITPVKPR